MRLFHVSEESDISVFNPRTPKRDDINKNTKLVWAIDEKHLPNYLLPRNCPRVTYHIGKSTSNEDVQKYFKNGTNHIVIIEEKWIEILKNTTLYLYEFDTKNFELQDDIAGYYISKFPQIPIAKYKICSLQKALDERNIELKTVDNLWDIADEIQNTTLNFSFCKMKFANSKK